MNARNEIIFTRYQEDTSSSNRLLLASKGIDYGLLSLTQTGLNKSIADAVGSLRIYLKDNDIHDYHQQDKGVDSKVKISCVYVSDQCSYMETFISLYRPETKNGDPRIWVYGLKKYASAGDDLAFISQDDTVYVFNISRFLLNDSDVFNGILRKDNEISNELLSLIKEISSRGLLKSVMSGNYSTAIGRTIESALGIDINSSPMPDYKGIELKSGRTKKKASNNRATLFAKVPDWNISKLKSSGDILDAYGYPSGLDRKLYCTVSSKSPNTQGLFFRVDFENDLLVECSEHDGDIVSWFGDGLRDKLVEKHKETFWIKAESIIENNHEYFRIDSITHTKKPLFSQFFPMVDEGIITMDHLIKRVNGKSSASEKGPLFKISHKNLALLFPDPVYYDLSMQ